jgi:hypothetical protein
VYALYYLLYGLLATIRRKGINEAARDGFDIISRRRAQTVLEHSLEQCENSIAKKSEK